MNITVLGWFAMAKLMVATGLNPLGLVAVALFWPQPEAAPVVVVKTEQVARND